MSRNMIAANTVVFRLLDEYCQGRGEPLSRAGRPRWISSAGRGKRFLKYAIWVAELPLSPSVKIGRFDFANRAFFVTSGLDVQQAPHPLRTEDLDGGILTAFLSELKVSPSASPFEIRNVVDFGDKTTPGYDGIDAMQVVELYPKLQVFSVQDLLTEESFKMFFLLCLADTRRSDHWIDEQLSSVLNLVTELSPASIPFQTLCRSILDVDPGALFLALYRCLEALYSHRQTETLMATLGIAKPWTEMAQTLEATLGWYPREEASLETLLADAVFEDLASILSALNEKLPDQARIQASVARIIYQLRNSLVHYRPFQQKRSFREVDWNRLCEAMALLVLHIHGEILTRTPVVL